MKDIHTYEETFLVSRTKFDTHLDEHPAAACVAVRCAWALSQTHVFSSFQEDLPVVTFLSLQTPLAGELDKKTQSLVHNTMKRFLLPE